MLEVLCAGLYLFLYPEKLLVLGSERLRPLAFRQQYLLQHLRRYNGTTLLHACIQQLLNHVIVFGVSPVAGSSLTKNLRWFRRKTPTPRKRLAPQASQMLREKHLYTWH